ncbi:7-cyano-7-deazaguanine synthase [Actinocatenispora rupis]|uniref:7-cyano-7-deazaguanine synthase (Queuosine biosynthesis) n=1 Tax=Actinocatenispora rupis TaxID=519421 RepID=A0A8J3IZC5_9ACTN|nr:7-cyano-7-deazaguanine synthase [Actinocatenispora rupis]GID11378.1 hypothetical protein Aru02nite_22670 [Actinocatenispora rupis]
MSFRYDIDNSPRGEAPRRGWERLPLKQLRATMATIEGMAAPAGRDTQHWGDDMFLVARAVYLADRMSDRRSTTDRWTRAIELQIPVVEYDRWTSVVVGTLHELLSLLTGDHWTVTIRPSSRAYTLDDMLPLPVIGGRQAEEIALFSGGLDSASYAARSVYRNTKTAYIGYAHPNLKGRVSEVFRRLRMPEHFHPVPLDVFNPKDMTFRSRGFLFVGTAIRAASAYEARRVVVPENGQLALNPPLTDARAASCSTRSVHPRTLYLFNRLLAELEMPVAVVNPFERLTKGEVCRSALDAGADAETLFRTISCGHPPIERGRSTSGHCGRCFPCLVRRSALLAALGSDRSDYQYDYGGPGADVLALRRWLGTRFMLTDLLADTPLPATTGLLDAYETVVRGRQELARLFQSLPHNHDLYLDAAA